MEKMIHIHTKTVQSGYDYEKETHYDFILHCPYTQTLDVGN